MGGLNSLKRNKMCKCFVVHCHVWWSKDTSNEQKSQIKFQAWGWTWIKSRPMMNYWSQPLINHSSFLGQRSWFRCVDVHLAQRVLLFFSISGICVCVCDLKLPNLYHSWDGFSTFLGAAIDFSARVQTMNIVPRFLSWLVKRFRSKFWRTWMDLAGNKLLAFHLDHKQAAKQDKQSPSSEWFQAIQGVDLTPWKDSCINVNPGLINPWVVWHWPDTDRIWFKPVGSRLVVVYRFFQLWQEILGLRFGSQCISKLRSRSHCISTKVQCENSSVELPHFLNESRMFNLHGGFLSHGGTPSHHPFLDGILPL